MFYFDLDPDGTVQTAGLPEPHTTVLDVTETGSLAADGSAGSTVYHDAVLVLLTVQLFVLVVIAVFTIVRRSD